ncbi:MAG: hypothetical protein HY726_09535 [Candidatus Rokubacteria bacterium]|nr:hypothetical protein [Candidatus Rokubacteria bacterium]
MRRAGLAGIAMAIAGLVLASSSASGHLFHKIYEPPENQLTKDARLLRLLIDDPTDRFELARQVYEGETRIRIKPGGFRKWLKRPIEPGMVFRASYQLNRWSGSLKEEAERIDQEQGTDLAGRMAAGLDDRKRDVVAAAMREMFVVLIGELLESLWQRVEDEEAAARLYGYVLSYYSINLEGYLNIHHLNAATTARTALDAMTRALGDPETGAPPAPEAFDKQRRRFLRVLREVVGPR